MGDILTVPDTMETRVPQRVAERVAERSPQRVAERVAERVAAVPDTIDRASRTCRGSTRASGYAGTRV